MMHVDGPIVAPVGQYWCSDPLPTEPFQFYRLEFEADAAAQGYWVVFPFAADGTEMRADTHSAVYPTDGWETQVSYFRGLPGATSVQLGFRGIGSDVTARNIAVTPVQDAEVRAWADELYKTLDPVVWQPAPDRHRLIPDTMARLRTGEAIRVVMLGDSISQDTCNSFYDIFVEADYPGDLQLVPSVDGSKGCWYYLDDDRFKRYVIDQEPELLMIGTASEHHGIEPVEKFLLRVRKELDCEMMVVSGPMGTDYRFPSADDSENVRKGREKVPRRREFAAEQAALCARMGVEYLDLCTAWLDFLEASEKPRNWYHRDAGHADDRGKRILAEFMNRYWAAV